MHISNHDTNILIPSIY